MLKWLAVICAFELALPTGWCCQLDAADWFSGPASDSSSANQPCCCCGSESANQQDCEATQPSGPVSCCCKPVSAMVSKDAIATADLTASPLRVQVNDTSSVSHDAVPTALFPTVPLNLLHSVWLC
jgi:hypothetical protein